MVGRRREEEVVVCNCNNEYGDGVAWIRGSMIGKGGFGSVYSATLKNSRSKYSYYPPLMAVKSAEVSASSSIQKEREVLSNVRGCPHIIKCFGEETTTGHNGLMVYNLLLEYGSGGTLADRIRIKNSGGGEGLSEFEVRVYARSILRGLNHIHGVGYVHCDLKPDNILLFPNNAKTGRISEFRVKIADFGLAKRAEQSKKRKRELYWRGTPMYLSPEAVLENVQEAPSDVWALGCIVFEMLTGKPPWELSAADEILKKIGEEGELPRIPNGISKEARSFLKGCFVRKSMFRLTAQMLLNHPFLEGLADDGAVEESEEVEDLNDIESIMLVSASYDEFSSEEWSVGSEDGSIYYWSEEEFEDDISSGFAEEDEEEEDLEGEEIETATVSSTGTGFDQVNETKKLDSSQVLPESRQHYPVSLIVPAGV